MKFLSQTDRPQTFQPHGCWAKTMWHSYKDVKENRRKGLVVSLETRADLGCATEIPSELSKTPVPRPYLRPIMSEFPWVEIRMTLGFFCCCFVFCFFRAAPTAYGGPQARGPTGATAAGLCHSSWQHQIFNPQSKAKDRTDNLMVRSQVHFRCTTIGTPRMTLFQVPSCPPDVHLGWKITILGSAFHSAPSLSPTVYQAWSEALSIPLIC